MCVYDYLCFVSVCVCVSKCVHVFVCYIHVCVSPYLCVTCVYNVFAPLCVWCMFVYIWVCVHVCVCIYKASFHSSTENIHSAFCLEVIFTNLNLEMPFPASTKLLSFHLNPWAPSHQHHTNSDVLLNPLVMGWKVGLPGFEQDPRLCISSQLPRNADAAGLVTALWIADTGTHNTEAGQMCDFRVQAPCYGGSIGHYLVQEPWATVSCYNLLNVSLSSSTVDLFICHPPHPYSKKISHWS